MSKAQKTEIKEKGELKGTVASLRKEIADLAMQHVKGQLKATTQLRTKKDELARVLTQITMQKTMEKSVRQTQDEGKETK